MKYSFGGTIFKLCTWVGLAFRIQGLQVEYPQLVGLSKLGHVQPLNPNTKVVFLLKS